MERKKAGYLLVYKYLGKIRSAVRYDEEMRMGSIIRCSSRITVISSCAALKLPGSDLVTWKNRMMTQKTTCCVNLFIQMTIR